MSDPSSQHTLASPSGTESTNTELASAMLDDELLSLGIIAQDKKDRAWYDMGHIWPPYL